MKRSSLAAGTALLAGLVGLGIGLSGYTFLYARGYSYLTDDPAACANCHVMQDHYDSWLKSSHHAVASCNDCHTPAPTLAKYSVKAINGFNHSLAFTTGRFHEPLRANDMNRRVAQQACLKCHATFLHEIRWLEQEDSAEPPALPSCERCHGAVGHPL